MRAETGPMQFGDDWTGVFIRGDYAGPMAMYLQALLEGKACEIEKFQLLGLVSVLANSNEFGDRVGLQKMKAFEEARKGTEA